MAIEDKYIRQALLPEIGRAGQEYLAKASVLIVGAGGLGCPVLLYLAAAGVGTIGLVDDDTVAVSNLHRQVLYGESDTGQLKVIVAARRIAALHSGCVVRCYPVRLTGENGSNLMRDYDVIVDGTDNFETRYLLSDLTGAVRKPLVFGSIFRYEGQVSVFNHRHAATYRDLFPEPGNTPACAEAGVLGILPGVIGTLMATEVIKIITGAGRTLSGRLLRVDLFKSRFDELVYDDAAIGPDPENATVRNNTFLREDHSDPTDAYPVRARGAGSGKEEGLPYGAGRETFRDIPAPDDPEAPLAAEVARSGAERGEFVLVDVRELYEFEENPLGAVHLSLYDLPRHYDALPWEKKVVFVCEAGNKSRIAYRLMRGYGKECYWTRLKSG